MSFSKYDNGEGLHIQLFKKYKNALREQPLLTKSCSSAVLSGLGNIVAQSSSGKKFKWQSVFAYCLTAFIYVGPTMHHFYAWLEKAIPVGTSYYTIKRIILDRFILAPPWLFFYFYLLSRFEGLGHIGAMEKISQTFGPILKTNLKVWTIFQYININYVPKEFRVLFASCLSFFWNIYVVLVRQSPSS